MSSTRFDSDEYLDAWVLTRQYPAIHTPLFELVRVHVGPAEGAVVDVGSSTGLLSRRLADAGFTVRAVEASPAAIASGKAAGTYDEIPVRMWRLLPQDLDEFAYWLSAHQIKIVVARRVVSELDTSGVTPALFADTLHAAGVEHLFLEGRLPRSGTTHRLDCLDKELAEITTGWRIAVRDGAHRVWLRAVR